LSLLQDILKRKLIYSCVYSIVIVIYHLFSAELQRLCLGYASLFLLQGLTKKIYPAKAQIKAMFCSIPIPGVF